MSIYDGMKEELSVEWDTILAWLACATCGGALVGVLWGMLG
jgi:hypothetical protein